MHVMVMGVSGCGKSTVGSALASRFGAEFLEGDSFHTAASRAKMGSGVPLTDEDRGPWVESLCAALRERGLGDGVGVGVVLACSGLRRAHRARLCGAGIGLIVFLDGEVGVILDRLRSRERAGGHYMGAGMLDSQLAALERPGEGEPVVVVDAGVSADLVIESAERAVRDALRARWRGGA